MFVAPITFALVATIHVGNCSTNVLVTPEVAVEPTPSQLVTLVHDTARSWLFVAPFGFGLDTTDHAEPFHDSTNVFVALELIALPTASQLDGPVHDTPDRPLVVAPAGFGLGTTDHTEPFHDSTNVKIVPALTEPPTAMQLNELVHDTPVRTLVVAPVGFGLGTTDHTEPFHDSTNVMVVADVVNCPTAMQLVAARHDTAENSLAAAPIGFGLDTTDHTEPFHRSTNAVTVLEATDAPTASQLDPLAHATPDRTLCDAPVGFGLATSDHTEPFHDSTNDLVTVEVVYFPTATQPDVLMHDTADSSLSVAPVGFGLDTSDHTEPFHDSTNVFVTPELSKLPTAMQLDGPAHDKPDS